MSVKEICSIAHNNLKGRKNIGKLLKRIFFLALLVFFLANAILGSIDNAIQMTRETPIARNLVYKNLDEGQLKQLEEVCEEINYVQGIYSYVYEIPAEIKGMERTGTEQLIIKACTDNYQEYLVEGVLPEKDEILLPHYMYVTHNGSYENSSQYIGNVITVFVTNCNGERREYQCKVSGTYDNVYATTGSDIALLHPENAVYLYELSMEGIEECLKRDMEASGDYEPSHFEGYEIQYNYAVVLDSLEHVEIVRDTIHEKLGISGSLEADTGGGYIQMIYPFIKLIGYGIAIILMVAVILMLTIMVRNDIRGRRKEIAMYQVQGYTKKYLKGIFIMEYLIRFVPVLIVAGVVAKGVLLVANFVIQNYLSMELHVIQLQFSIRTLGTGIIIWGIVMAMAVYAISEQFKTIVLLDEIKSEG